LRPQLFCCYGLQDLPTELGRAESFHQAFSPCLIVQKENEFTASDLLRPEASRQQDGHQLDLAYQLL